MAHVDGIVRQWRRGCARMTFEEFYRRFSRIACSNWGIIDPSGRAVSCSRKAGYAEIRQQNATQLWMLPFPPQIVLRAVDAVCRSGGAESVELITGWLVDVYNAASGSGIELGLSPFLTR